jgi:hypothetical protein
MSDVARRRDQQIVDAINNDAVKQALSLCTKRLKKGEKTDSLSVRLSVCDFILDLPFMGIEMWFIGTRVYIPV